MSRHYSLPITFALIALSFSLTYSISRDLRAEWRGDTYLGYAASMVKGDGYSGCQPQPYIRCEDFGHAYRLPGYPLYLAGNLLLFGINDPLPGIRLLQSVLVSALVLLSVGLACRLAGTAAAITTGVLITLNPTMYQFAYLPLTEHVSAVGIMLLLWMLVTKRYTLWLGVLMAALLLTRGGFALAMPLLALCIPRRRWLMVVVGGTVVFAPWWLHNWLMLGQFIPFSTGSGTVLYGANSAYAIINGHGHWLNPRTFPNWQLFAALGELEQDALLKTWALVEARAMPPDVLIAHLRAKVMQVVVQSGVVIRLAAGLSLLAINQRVFRLAGALWLGLLLNTLIFWGDARFRTPMDAPLFVIAGVGVARLFHLVGFIGHDARLNFQRNDVPHQTP